MEIFTYGLGGDSYIQVNRDKDITWPQRVWPLCEVAHEYPYLVDDLKINFEESYDFHVCPYRLF